MRRSERDIARASRVTTRRSLMLGGVMTSVVGVLGFRMWQLGVRDAEEYYLLAEENRINLRLVRPDRGRIFDRAGKIVADNEHTYRIMLVKEEARDVDDVLAKLQRLLGLTSEDIDRIREQLDRVRGFVPVTVKDRVTWEELSIIALNTPALPGVHPEMVLSRIYPFGPDFAHQVGYVGPGSDSADPSVSSSARRSCPGTTPMYVIPRSSNSWPGWANRIGEPAPASNIRGMWASRQSVASSPRETSSVKPTIR